MNESPQWGELPVLAISRVYSFLNTSELLTASSTCWNWRSTLFQKRFFRDFKFKLRIDNERQFNFFMQSLSNLTSVLTIVFDGHNVYHVDKVRRVLFKVGKSDHLVGIRFQTNCTDIAIRGKQYQHGETYDLEQFFIEPIKSLLSRKVPPFKILDLGALEHLTLYATEFLKALARPQYLEEATLASVKIDPSHYPVLVIEPTLFEKCTSLQVLSLDYDALDDEVLQTLQILPLKKFMICVHGLDETHPGISNAAWSNFAAKFENIELILTLIYAYEAVEVLQQQILRPSMPLTHLRVLFCSSINVEALEFISRYLKDTIKSVWWIDPACQEMDRNVMDLYFGSGQDPFVMMSWLCKSLEEIVIHGYVVDPHNLVGISRLRGKSLKKLEVSMLDPSPASDMMDSFIEEISTQLGQKWIPFDSSNIHPALGYVPVTDDIRDEYVINVVRSDLAQ